MAAALKIHPETRETVTALLKMLAQPVPKPIVEMTDQTARDIAVIWQSIQALASTWRGKQDMHIPLDPVNRKEYWGSTAQRQGETTPVLAEFLKTIDGKDKVAIDLGCGNSKTIPLLLQKGWKVIAVDSAPQALQAVIRDNPVAVKTGRLEIREEDITSFTSENPVDLVIAVDVLPYTDPKKFQATWAKIHRTVKNGGTFVGTLFRMIEEERSFMNSTTERGAWMIPDRRMVRPLLEHAGYDIKTCVYRQDTPTKKQMCIQFVAQKK